MRASPDTRLTPALDVPPIRTGYTITRLSPAQPYRPDRYTSQSVPRRFPPAAHPLRVARAVRSQVTCHICSISAPSNRTHARRYRTDPVRRYGITHPFPNSIGLIPYPHSALTSSLYIKKSTRASPGTIPRAAHESPRAPASLSASCTHFLLFNARAIHPAYSRIAPKLNRKHSRNTSPYAPHWRKLPQKHGTAPGIPSRQSTPRKTAHNAKHDKRFAIQSPAQPTQSPERHKTPAQTYPAGHPAIPTIPRYANWAYFLPT